MRSGQIKSGECERRSELRLRFGNPRTRISFLVPAGRWNKKGQTVVSSSGMGHGKATALIFLLAQQVKEPKRLGLARDQTWQWTVCRG